MRSRLAFKHASRSMPAPLVRTMFIGDDEDPLTVPSNFTVAEGSQAEFDSAADTVALRGALLPDAEYDGMLENEDSTVLSRVAARSSLTERACNSADNLCVLSSSRCNTYCRRCHVAGSGCRDCAEGICAGFLGLTCTCQTPCVSC